MKKYINALIISLFCFGSAPAMAEDSSPKSEKSPLVVAEMGDVKLSGVEWEATKSRLTPDVRENLDKDASLRARLVQDALVKKYLLKKARESGFDKKPAVQEQIERTVEQSLLAQYVLSHAEPAADFPSEDELKTAYGKNKDLLRGPGQVHVAQIFLAVPPDASEAVKKEVHKKIQRIFKDVSAAPKKFGEVAKNQSDHKASAEKGGDLGWLGGEQLLPEMVSVLNALKPNEVGHPVQSAGGWHVLKLLEAKKGDVLPFDAVKETLASALRRQETQRKEQEYFKKLIEEHPPTLLIK